jgi:ribosomal protein L37AE/L43A
MSTKLQNIRAVRQMLDGTHKTQSSTKVGFNSTEKAIEEKRQIGDIWKDEKGEEWEQRAGFKIKKGKLDEIRQMINANKMPAECPKCNQPMSKKLDATFWKLEKHCFDCQVDFEHQLRIEGKYEQYEKDRILKNAESWLADAEQEAKEIIEAFRNPLAFANSDGTLEQWEGGMSSDEIADKIQEEFEVFKTNFIEKLK